jgi:hypothetical protein
MMMELINVNDERIKMMNMMKMMKMEGKKDENG